MPTTATCRGKQAPPVTLEIILPAKGPADKEVAAIARAVNAAGLTPASVVVSQMHDLKSFQPNTPRPWGPIYEEMAAAARNSFPESVLGGGMVSYFTELNRKPVPKGGLTLSPTRAAPLSMRLMMSRSCKRLRHFRGSSSQHAP
jgi:hypothetical protein